MCSENVISISNEYISSLFVRICSIDVQEKQLTTASTMVVHPDERIKKVCFLSFIRNLIYLMY